FECRLRGNGAGADTSGGHPAVIRIRLRVKGAGAGTSAADIRIRLHVNGPGAVTSAPYAGVPIRRVGRIVANAGVPIRRVGRIVANAGVPIRRVGGIVANAGPPNRRANNVVVRNGALRHYGTVTLLELLAGTARTRVVPLHVGPVGTGGCAAGDTGHACGRLWRQGLLPAQPDDCGIGTRCGDFL